jgi:hypothetical protein
MSLPLRLATQGLRQSHAHLSTNVVRFPRIPRLIKITMRIYLYITLIILGILGISRATSATLELHEPSQIYLPGNPLNGVSNGNEDMQYQSLYVTSRTDISGQIVYLYYDATYRMIVRTVIRANMYKLGDLIFKWGTPTGFYRHDASIFVYWGTRTAIFYTGSFRPDSRVEFIEYAFNELQVSPWGGFTTKRYLKNRMR